MKTIYLQGQGSTRDLNTHNSINSQLGFSLRIGGVGCSHCIIEIGKEDKRVIIQQEFKDLESVFRRAEFELSLLGEEITISDTIERYCHDYHNDYYNKYLAVCFYEKNTETIRLYPEKYCLVSFSKEGTEEYLQADKATEKYLPILRK